MTTKGEIAFVGIGPGDPDLLTVRAAELLGRADTIVVDAAPPASISRHFRPEATVVDFSALESGRLPGKTERAKYLLEAAKSGQRVVRLVPGDPFFDTQHDEISACAKAHIPFEVVPGVPHATAVPAYAGIPLVDARHHEVRIVDARAGAPKWAEVAKTTATLVVLGVEDVAGTAEALIAAGRASGTPVAVTRAGTTTEQHTVASTLDSLAADVKAAGLEPPVVMVVGDVVKHRDAFSWFEAKPLFGWRVLVPRTKEQAAILSEKLRAYGAVPVEVPTISVEPPRTPQQMDRAIRGLVTGRYEWIAFTSVNAVRAVREKIEEYGLDARAFSGIKIAAVGEQTAASLLAYGIKPDLVPSGEQSAAGLVADFPAYDRVLDPINRVLLPRADIATETLVAGLIELGWEVEEVVAYRTVRAAPPPAPIREAIKTGGFDAVCFTSSSTVRNLVGIAGKPHASTVIACIGPQTAKTAEEHGLRVDVLAPQPSIAALVDALAEFGRAQREAAIAAGEWTGKPGRPKTNPRRKSR
ncbi:MAG: bifunctional uroporphyrinogen-III C-methyltransferase/uroporphyrinogen-III synthase [Acidothermus sp.]|nr:bifunctional uroporphyrinogen-III C-methyltransferase/uroporphyrinogen-III synthase [Acidothermus sp.]